MVAVRIFGIVLLGWLRDLDVGMFSVVNWVVGRE